MTSAPSTERRASPDWMVLAIVCLGQFMVILDVSVVNVALPSIRRSLGFTAADLQWVVNAYTLTFAGFMLLGGRAADLFGRRRIFLLGLGLFTVASLAGGFAQDRATLITARALQGLGGAVLSPATLTILTARFRDSAARARALGIWSAVAAGGGAAGALLGGVLTDLLSWRWVLFVNVPVGVIGFVAARFVLEDTRAEEPRRSLDVVGSLLVTSGLVVLVYGIVETQVRAWTAPGTIVTLAVAAALLAGFVLWEARGARSPLMPLRLFASRSLSGANVVIFLLAAAMFSMWYFLSLYMQNVLRFNPLQAGLAFVPQTLSIVVGAQISSRLVTRIGPRPLLIFSPLLAAASMAWLSRITPDGTFLGQLLVPGALLALSLGLSFTPVTLAATAGVPIGEAGLASGLVNTTRQVGGAIGLAALATLAEDRTLALFARSSRSARAFIAAQSAGFARAFAVSVWLLVAASVAAWIVPARVRPRAQGVETPSPAEAAAAAPSS